MSVPVRSPSAGCRTPEADEEPLSVARPGAVLVIGACHSGALVAAALTATGLDGLWRRDETEAADALSEHAPNLLLVEIPAWSDQAADRCRRLAAFGLPMIALIGQGGSGDRALALDAGLEDCLTAPWAPSELAARVRRLLSRSRPGPLEFGDWRLDPASRQVVGRDLRRVCLGPAEWAVLSHLLLHRGRITPAGELAAAASRGVSGRPFQLNHLRVLLHRLRAKLGRDRRGRPAIICLRGRGYTLCPAGHGPGYAEGRPGRLPAPVTACLPRSAPSQGDGAHEFALAAAVRERGAVERGFGPAGTPLPEESQRSPNLARPVLESVR